MEEKKLEPEGECEGIKEGDKVKGLGQKMQGDRIAQFDQMISSLIETKMNED